MGYTNLALKDKIMEMYPEIGKNGIFIGLEYSTEKNAYIIDLKKNGAELKTHLDRKDADECMNGIKCVSLGMQVAEFISNFEELRKGS